MRYILTPRSWGNSPLDGRTMATGDSSAGVDSNIWRARGFTGCLRMCSVTHVDCFGNLLGLHQEINGLGGLRHLRCCLLLAGGQLHRPAPADQLAQYASRTRGPHRSFQPIANHRGPSTDTVICLGRSKAGIAIVVIRQFFHWPAISERGCAMTHIRWQISGAQHE